MCEGPGLRGGGGGLGSVWLHGTSNEACASSLNVSSQVYCVRFSFEVLPSPGSWGIASCRAKHTASLSLLSGHSRRLLLWDPLAVL